jgi:hypothetical protein
VWRLLHLQNLGLTGGRGLSSSVQPKIQGKLIIFFLMAHDLHFVKGLVVVQSVGSDVHCGRVLVCRQSLLNIGFGLQDLAFRDGCGILNNF